MMATMVGPMSRAKAIALVDGVGFSHPILREGARERRQRAFAGLITTAALTVSLAVAVVAVSFGIARADSQETPAPKSVAYCSV